MAALRATISRRCWTRLRSSRSQARRRPLRRRRTRRSRCGRRSTRRGANACRSKRRRACVFLVARHRRRLNVTSPTRRAAKRPQSVDRSRVDGGGENKPRKTYARDGDDGRRRYVWSIDFHGAPLACNLPILVEQGAAVHAEARTWHVESDARAQHACIITTRASSSERTTILSCLFFDLDALDLSYYNHIK